MENKEIETVKQEVTNNEEVKEEIKETSNEAQDISFKEKVENRRVEFSKVYTKKRKISNIITSACLVLLVVSIIFIVNSNKVLQYVGFGLVGAVIVGMIVYYFVGKNALPNATKEYINFVNAAYNEYLYSEKVFTKVTTDPKEKLDLATLISDKIYSGVTNTNTRNVIKATYNKKDQIIISDCALYVPGDKRTEKVCFLGKYISCYNKTTIEDRVIICLKGEKEIDLPTEKEDLQEFSFDNLIIYAKDESYKEKLGEKFLTKLSSFKHSEHLMTLNVVIWQGHTGIYMSYDDTTMVFPFKKEFDDAPIASLKDEILDILKISDSIN